MNIKKELEAIKENTIAGYIYIQWNWLFKREMPFFLSVLFRKKWSLNQTRFETYDGSNQCVHPDVIEYKGHLFSVYTPYPFAICAYENPQLAIYNSLNNKWECKKEWAPLTKPIDSSHYFYSDPFLFVNDDLLYIVYRLSDKKMNPKSFLCCRIYDGDVLHDEIRVIDTDDRDLISPFIVRTDRLWFFHVEMLDKKNVLYVRELLIQSDKFVLGNPKHVELKGFEVDESVWHIGVSSFENFNAKFSHLGRYIAVITCEKNGLYYSCYGVMKYDLDNEKWTLEKKDIISPLAKSGKFSYKGCLMQVGDCKYCLLSVFEKSNRVRIITLPFLEEFF